MSKVAMSNVAVYGIKNCDTMKKAMAWLDANHIGSTFHDYKKQGVDVDVLQKAIDQHGWENVINDKGTAWRKLPDETKAHICKVSALTIAQEHSSVIKRPLMIYNGTVYLGFKDKKYEDIFNAA